MDKSAPTTTTFQFRLRTIAAAITLLAVTFAALAPWLRQYDAGQWWRLAQVWLCGAAGFAFVVVIYSLLRRRAVSRSGRMLASVQMAGIGKTMVMAASIAVLNLYLVLWLSLTAASQQSGDVPHFVAGVIGFGTGVMTSLFVFRTGRLQLCEQGLLGPVTLIPWKSVQSWRWEGTDASRVLVMRIQLSTARFDARPDEEAAIEALLTSRVGRPDRVAG